MVVVYFILMLVGALSSSLKLFFLAKLLSKPDFGQYSYINSLVLYGAPIVTFGLVEGMSRRFPVLLGQGRRDEAYRLRNAAFRATAISSIFITVLITATGALTQWVTGRPLFLLFLIVAIEIYAYLAFTLAVRDIRSHLHTTSYAAIMCVKGIVEVAVIFAVARQYGYLAVLLSEIVIWSAAAAIVMTGMMQHVRFTEGDLRSIVPMVSEGAALSLAGILANTARMADRLVLGAFLPKVHFADYAFHLLIITAGSVISNVLGQYVWPHSLHLFGSSGGNARAVNRYLSRLTIWLALFGAIGTPLVPFVVKMVAARFFPSYTIDSTLLLILYGAAVLDVANFYPMVLLATGRTRRFMEIHVIGAGILGGGCLLVVATSSGLTLCAVFALTSRLFILIVTALSARRLVQEGATITTDAAPSYAE